MTTPILIGAVIYDPKVALIWEIIKTFFRDQGCAIDYVFYSNYELQVRALLDRHIDIAWNSPLAWVDAQRQTGNTCRALAMRDTDRDRVSHLVVRDNGGIDAVTDLRGRVVATGARDSPQATLLPLHLLRQQGLRPNQDFAVRNFDVLVGKHGDHIGGERDALASLQRGESDAAAVLDLNWTAWQADGTVDPARLEILASTPPFDHCNFTVLDAFPTDAAAQWSDVLFRMRYDNPAHREMMDLEGLKAWLPGRTSGYAALTEATRESGFFGA
jgi:ABC-type phosphate/phosphonate transport system substrate-binding protein